MDESKMILKTSNCRHIENDLTHHPRSSKHQTLSKHHSNIIQISSEQYPNVNHHPNITQTSSDHHSNITETSLEYD